MLRRFKDILGSSLHAKDGKIGHADDILFDDDKWTVRYVVAKTGGLLNRKRVLISPLGVAHVEWENHALKLRLTRKQIERSPEVDTDEPVFRKMEASYFNHYGWPYYWTGLSIWGIDPTSPLIIENQPTLFEADRARVKSAHGDPHLRSCRAVTGYAIEAEDSRFGHVEDFLFEDRTWIIRYLVVDIKTWWPSRSVLVAPEWVDSIDWRGGAIRVDLTRKAIEASPVLEQGVPVDRAYEDLLHRHYQRKNYWDGHEAPARKSGAA